MAYYTPFASQVKPGDYRPDKKDYNLARRLQVGNEFVGGNQIFSIEGRQFISTRRGLDEEDKTEFMRYFPKAQAAPAPKPAPKPKPKPKAAPAPAPTISAEAKQYRADTNKILQQAEATRNQFMIDQKNAAAAAEAQRKLDEQVRLEREQAIAATAAARSANAARAGRSANLQIQPAGQQPKTMGTQAFKRRKDQFNVSGAYGGLSKISSGMVNL